MGASELGWMIAGLGNPGARYAGTRHDLGFALVDRLAARAGAGFRRDGDAELAGPVRFVPSGPTVVLVRPMAYMNRSGRPIHRILEAFGVGMERTMVACDDVSLPFGRIRLRTSGSAGGHNGLRSVIEWIGDAFPRLRMGVGPRPEGRDLAEWVLERFEDCELGRVSDMLDRAEAIVTETVASGRVRPSTSDPETPSTEANGEARRAHD